MAQHEIKINLPGLLKMLGSNIYAEPDVAVREMIQNCHDTCIIRQTQDEGFHDPRIDVSFDKEANTLTFSDNGADMTEEELHENLATIGRSFTDIQRQELRGKGAQKALLLIGQFGIGLLSAFSIAERVEVFTRSCQPEATGFKWECAGDIHYTVEPFDKPDAGTRLVLHVSDRKLALLKEKRLRQAIKKYADFLSVPIFLHGARQQRRASLAARAGVQRLCGLHQSPLRSHADHDKAFPMYQTVEYGWPSVCTYDVIRHNPRVRRTRYLCVTHVHQS